MASSSGRLQVDCRRGLLGVGGRHALLIGICAATLAACASDPPPTDSAYLSLVRDLMVQAAQQPAPSAASRADQAVGAVEKWRTEAGGEGGQDTGGESAGGAAAGQGGGGT